MPTRIIDRKADAEAKEAAKQVFQRIYDWKPDADIKRDAKGQPYVNFSVEGQAIFNKFYTDLLKVKLRDPAIIPAFQSHLAKYASLMPKLAMIFYVVKCLDAGESIIAIDRESAEMAVCWIDYLESHAKKIYGGITSVEDTTTILLLRKILDNKIPLDAKGCFKAWTIINRGWSGLSNRKQVETALVALEEAGIVIPPVATGITRPAIGRPLTVWHEINPLVFKRYRKDGTYKTPKGATDANTTESEV